MGGGGRGLRLRGVCACGSSPRVTCTTIARASPDAAARSRAASAPSPSEPAGGFGSRSSRSSSTSTSACCRNAGRLRITLSANARLSADRTLSTCPNVPRPRCPSTSNCPIDGEAIVSDTATIRSPSSLSRPPLDAGCDGCVSTRRSGVSSGWTIDGLTALNVLARRAESALTTFFSFGGDAVAASGAILLAPGVTARKLPPPPSSGRGPRGAECGIAGLHSDKMEGMGGRVALPLPRPWFSRRFSSGGQRCSRGRRTHTRPSHFETLLVLLRNLRAQ